MVFILRYPYFKMNFPRDLRIDHYSNKFLPG
jgi:hypothetical protein